ncbi:MAG: glycosyl transferase [Methylothermaceae bacteria B42]|nr:MAG: glycosyl transferase [Methylothermaceae bacteria B42]HHJ39473.1 glycosyltransferase [Methylothermaceae bacterium]
MTDFSIIIPAYQEAETIETCLKSLQLLRDRAEIIVVDGGSHDNTVELSKPWADRVILASRGRARQMNAGVALTQGEILIFLHADTRLPPGALEAIHQGLQGHRQWGRFDIELEGKPPFLKVIASMMNLRSRLSGIATGDQVIFVKKEAFEKAGGYPDIPLMEDIALSKRLKQLSNPLCLRHKVTSSGRRWEAFGVGRTILLMWWLRLLYFIGISPANLAALYQSGRFLMPHSKTGCHEKRPDTFH